MAEDIHLIKLMPGRQRGCPLRGDARGEAAGIACGDDVKAGMHQGVTLQGTALLTLLKY